MRSTNERKKKIENKVELQRHDRIAYQLCHSQGINHH